jgi:DnaJ family protein C protein 22
MKNSYLALLLWLPPFGFFGSHHFYLGRNLQGLLWATSFGGYLVGWLRDLFLLNVYVEIANRRQVDGDHATKEVTLTNSISQS